MLTLIKDSLKPFFRYARSGRQREFIHILDKYGKKDRYTPCKIAFLHYAFEVPDCLSFAWQFKEIFADESYRFASDRIDPVIFDCGANVGTSCIYFKSLFPRARIRAYEADPVISDYLSGNLAANDARDIEVINKAVWIDNKGVRFGQDGADGGSVYGGGNRITVPSVRLRDEIEKEERIDFLKIDIEGAEADVIPDCRESLGRIRNVFIEYHSWRGVKQRLGEILDVLTGSGFRYYVRTVGERKAPFAQTKEEMDLQVNIFAYRK